MKTIALSELKKQYEFVCNEYIMKFSKNQDLEFDGWIGDEIGGVASFLDQYFFDLSDIILDINTKQPKGLILHSIFKYGNLIDIQSELDSRNIRIGSRAVIESDAVIGARAKIGASVKISSNVCIERFAYIRGTPIAKF